MYGQAAEEQLQSNETSHSACGLTFALQVILSSPFRWVALIVVYAPSKLFQPYLVCILGVGGVFMINF
jgi:hypothetical protein